MDTDKVCCAEQLASVCVRSPQNGTGLFRGTPTLERERAWDRIDKGEWRNWPLDAFDESWGEYYPSKDLRYPFRE